MTEQNQVEEGQLHRVHTGCDAERYSDRSHEDQRQVQRDLADLQERAAAHAKVPRPDAMVQPQGDGDLIRWPAGITAVDLLARFVPALYNELVQRNQRLTRDRQLRLRMAIVMGTSEIGPYGLVGVAPIAVRRLIDSAQLREALTAAPGYPLVVAVDDPIYQDVVRTGVGYLKAADYHKVVINEKGMQRTAWVTVPGQPTRKRTPRRRPPGADAARSDAADQEPDPPRPHRRWAINAAVAAAFVAAAGTIFAAVITGLFGLLANSPNSRNNQTPTENPPTTSVYHPSTTYPEIADNRAGVPTFADPGGAASPAGSIPYGTHVQVACTAPNASGMSSVNAFYRIASGPWAGTYAPANTFANGDPLGVAGTHEIDQQVPPCP